MDLRGLRYFVATVETGSITGAAGHCHISQPSISLAIQKLEDELDTVLLTRSRRGVKVTPAGDELYHRARRLLDESQAIVDHFKDRAGLPVLRVGIEASLSIDRLRKLFAMLHPVTSRYRLSFSRECKNVALRIQSGGNPLPDRPYFSLWQEEYALLVSAQHPLVQDSPPDPDDLNNLPLIELRFSEWTVLWQRLVQSTGLRFQTVAEADSEDWALAMVEAGIGACFAPVPMPESMWQVQPIPLSRIPNAPRIKREIGLAFNPALEARMVRDLEGLIGSLLTGDAVTG